jgi:hypothetical protein
LVERSRDGFPNAGVAPIHGPAHRFPRQLGMVCFVARYAFESAS